MIFPEQAHFSLSWLIIHAVCSSQGCFVSLFVFVEVLCILHVLEEMPPPTPTLFLVFIFRQAFRNYCLALWFGTWATSPYALVIYDSVLAPLPAT